MKNIITILLLLIIPILAYLIMNKNTETVIAVAKNNTPTLYIFSSTMCLDCKKMKEVIKEVEPIYYDKINFIHINALDKNKKVKEHIKRYGVTLVPTLVFTDINGNKTNKIEGYIERDKLQSEIEDAING